MELDKLCGGWLQLEGACISLSLQSDSEWLVPSPVLAKRDALMNGYSIFFGASGRHPYDARSASHTFPDHAFTSLL